MQYVQFERITPTHAQRNTSASGFMLICYSVGHPHAHARSKSAPRSSLAAQSPWSWVRRCVPPVPFGHHTLGRLLTCSRLAFATYRPQPANAERIFIKRRFSFDMYTPLELILWTFDIDTIRIFWMSCMLCIDEHKLFVGDITDASECQVLWSDTRASSDNNKVIRSLKFTQHSNNNKF